MGGIGVLVAVGGTGVEVTVGLRVIVGVRVWVGVNVKVGDSVGVIVGVGVGVKVMVGVGVKVAVGPIVGVSVGVAVLQEPEIVRFTVFDKAVVGAVKEVMENWFEMGPGQETCPHH